MERKSFIFYESFYNSIAQLDKQIQADVILALVRYGLKGETESNLKPVAKALFESFRPQIDANNRRYLNGLNGGAPNGNKNAIKNNQETTKKQPKNNQKQPNEEGVMSNVVMSNENEKEERNDKSFTAPTLSDVRQYFLEKGYTEQSAVRAFDYYDSAGWKDSKGNKVKNWKQKMIAVWFKDENKIQAVKKQVITMF